MSKLSVKHFELLTQGTHVSWNYTVKQKLHKMCLLLLWKSERRKNNYYLVFGDKKDVFLFFKQDKYLTRLAFAQDIHALLKEPQNSRRLTE